MSANQSGTLNVFLKSVTYQPTLSKFRGGPVKKNHPVSSQMTAVQKKIGMHRECQDRYEEEEEEDRRRLEALERKFRNEELLKDDEERQVLFRRHSSHEPAELRSSGSLLARGVYSSQKLSFL